MRSVRRRFWLGSVLAVLVLLLLLAWFYDTANTPAGGAGVIDDKALSTAYVQD
jgi:hypothetical protein